MLAERRCAVAVIGGGPAGLMAAQVCAASGLPVTVFDAKPTPGRKFLVAGRGGLNLTHSEPLPGFTARYGRAAGFFAPLLARFSPTDLRAWADRLGAETFVGTSGRVFPREFKAATLLQSWLDDLRSHGVRFRGGLRWAGVTPAPVSEEGRVRLRFVTDAGGEETVLAEAAILALGGASWPQTGSDGGWVETLRAAGVHVDTLRPANCGFEAPWSPAFAARWGGTPLKSVALSFAGVTVRGEAMITSYGIEGTAVYALAAALRDALARGEGAELRLDLRPESPAAAIAERLADARPGDSLANRLRKRLRLPPIAAALLRELAPQVAAGDAQAVAAALKSLPLRLTAPRPIAEAISSAGGIALAELDQRLMLQRLPGVFACGEMLDWEAPTGGYLLQGSMTTGWCAGEGVVEWLARRGRAVAGCAAISGRVPTPGCIPAPRLAPAPIPGTSGPRS